MPSRKADQIFQIMRNEILEGRHAPGAKLPTYDALVEQFGVTRPTVSRVLKSLRGEGLIAIDGKRGIFVATVFPHNNRYLWVTSEQPGSMEWFWCFSNSTVMVEKGETGLPCEVVPLVGVDGRANNVAYQTLCEAVEHRSVAGLMLMNSATTYLLPALQTPGLPRVAIWAPLPHAALLSLDFDALIERACARLLEKGRRIAVISPHAPNLDRSQAYLFKRGLAKDRLWALHVAPVGCERITELLFDRADRPDAVFVTDDNLVTPLLAGLKRAKVRVKRDVHVLAHCNWPRPIGAAEGVEHIGFDVREVLLKSKECIDAQRAGDESPGRLVPPRFANELLHPMAARRARDQSRR